MKQMMIICVLAVAGLAGQSAAIITDVYVTPTEPTVWEGISVVTSGIAPRGGVTLTGTDFRINGSQLELDLNLHLGLLTRETPWTFSEGVGSLTAGSYDLTVTAYYNLIVLDPSVYSYSFEVVPEPVTAMLLGTGFLGMLVNRRRR